MKANLALATMLATFGNNLLVPEKSIRPPEPKRFTEEDAKRIMKAQDKRLRKEQKRTGNYDQ